MRITFDYDLDNTEEKEFVSLIQNTIEANIDNYNCNAEVEIIDTFAIVQKEILKDLRNSDHYSACGYDCWKHFLSDGYSGDYPASYNNLLYESEINEDFLESLWKMLKRFKEL